MLLVADFETTTNIEKTEVWLSAFKNIDDDNYYIQENIEDFFYN